VVTFAGFEQYREIRGVTTNPSMCDCVGGEGSRGPFAAGWGSMWCFLWGDRI